MTLNPIQRRLLAEDLVRLRRPDEQRRYASSQRQGRVDPNPHQIDAVVFALQAHVAHRDFDRLRFGDFHRCADRTRLLPDVAVLIEALIIGAVGSVAGLFAGIGIAGGLNALFKSSGSRALARCSAGRSRTT